MTLQPTIEFSFAPSCEKLSCLCCCCKDDDEDQLYYPNKKGKLVPTHSMSDMDIVKANARFRDIIIRKIDPLPLDNDEFLDRLENEEYVSLEVTRENPLTKARIDYTVKKINEILHKMTIF